MSIASDLIRGHTDTIILAQLLQEDSYGYKINKRIQELTQNEYELKEATLYTSCEPCPMCLMASKWANIGNIFYAATRKDAAKIGFQDADLYKLLKRGKYATPVKECRALAIKVMRKWKKKFGESANY